MTNDLISRSELKKEIASLVVNGESRINEVMPRYGGEWVDGIASAYREIDNAPTVWHPFTEEPTEEGRQYLVQHFYKTWDGRSIITYEVVPSLEELLGIIYFINKNGNRDNHYQAWMKIEPYEEDRE